MMKKSILLVTMFMSLVSAGSLFALDEKVAASFEKLFSYVTPASPGKALGLVSPEKFIQNIEDYKKNYLILDIRSRQEAAIFGMSFNALNIPAPELFQLKNLKRLPADKKLLVLCSSGARSAAIGTALRGSGFDNVHILMGGLEALAKYLATPAPLFKKK
jgi:rhodanese-related sulfurtransferase